MVGGRAMVSGLAQSSVETNAWGPVQSNILEMGKRWPPYWTVMFVAGSSAGLWLLLIAAAARLLDFLN